MPDDQVTSDASRQALNRVLDSPEFASATRLSSFLRYVVTETLAGRGSSIKGYSIAVDVFERPADFDQTHDPIVRVEASRLRRALAQYYHGSGAQDPVVIELPRGAYVPAFHWKSGEGGNPETSAAEAPPPGPVSPAAVILDDPTGPSPDAVPAKAALFTRSRIMALAAIIIAAALGGIVLWEIVERAATPAASDRAIVSTLTHGPIVGFAAFETMSGDDTDTRIARGLVTEMIAEFTRFRNLSIYEPAPEAPAANSGYIVSGNLRRSSEDIRATIQLVDASNGRTIWSETYDRVYTASSLLTVQDEIARAAAVAVAQPYGPIYQREIERVASEPPDAIGYTCVLRVSDYWRKLDPETHLRMRTCLEKTIAADPEYADAWQVFTYMFLDEYRYGFNVRPRSAYEPLNKALETAQKAVSLASTDARSYQALYAVYFYRGDQEGFKRAGAQAVKLNPNSPDIAADFGGKLAFSGAWEEGLPLVRKAMSLNPGHPGWYYVSLVLDAYRRGDYPEALAFIERMSLPNHYRTHIFLAMTYGQMGDRMNAAASIERLLEFDPDFAINARTDLKKWGFEPGLVSICIDGLRKAGLQISDG